MAVWFPALRATLAARLGPYLPPHPLRALSGAALAALLAWAACGALYGFGLGVYGLWTGTTNLVASVGDTATDLLKSVPRAVEQNATSPNSGQNGTHNALQGAGQTGVLGKGQNAALAGGDNATLPASGVLNQHVTLTPDAIIVTDDAAPARNLPYPPVRGVPFVRAELEAFELPYAEGPDMTFQDAARQVDYAVSQTLLRLGMDFSRLEILQIEPRVFTDTSPIPLSSPDSGKTRRPELYQFQRLRVHLPGSAPDFVTMLVGNLETWAEPAVLEQAKRQGRTLLRVVVNGTPTHEIFLQPAGSVFAQPPQHEDPRMTVVIDDMGGDLNALRTLLHLDMPITFSVLPSTAYAEQTAAEAAAAGQEVLLHQPMEPMQAPYVNAGPDALLLSMTPDAQRDILRRNIAKLPQAVGLNNHMGSRATKDRPLSRLVADEAAAAGLFVLDSLTTPDSILFDEARNVHVAAYKRTFFIDDGSPTRRGILSILQQAEQAALRTGHAIVIGHPRPETLAALQQWAHERDSVVSLVPLRYQAN